MSHVAKVTLKIKDLDALAEACRQCGLELVRGQRTYKWYGRSVGDYGADDLASRHGHAVTDWGKCEHAIRVQGNDRAYEIGVVRDTAGDLSLVYDNWMGGYGLEDKAGKGLDKLKQFYAATVGARMLLKKGYNVVRSVVNNNLVVTGTKA